MPRAPRLYDHAGQRLAVREIAALHGLAPSTVRARLARGLPAALVGAGTMTRRAAGRRGRRRSWWA